MCQKSKGSARVMKLSAYQVTCSTLNECLEDYLDGKLSRGAALGAERHLKACSTCSEMVTEIRELRECAKSLFNQAIPRNVSERLRTRIAGEVKASVKDSASRTSDSSDIRTMGLVRVK